MTALGTGLRLSLATVPADLMAYNSTADAGDDGSGRPVGDRAAEQRAPDTAQDSTVEFPTATGRISVRRTRDHGESDKGRKGRQGDEFMHVIPFLAWKPCGELTRRRDTSCGVGRRDDLCEYPGDESTGWWRTARTLRGQTGKSDVCVKTGHLCIRRSGLLGGAGQAYDVLWTLVAGDLVGGALGQYAKGQVACSALARW